jgi:hypothetical protein
MPYVGTVKAKSGVAAVQVVYMSRRGLPGIEHLGSAHDEAEMEALTAAARQRAAGARPGRGARGRRAAADHLLAEGHLPDALERAY